MPYGVHKDDWPGVRYYWDPVGGNDSNDGLSIVNARLTFASVYGLLTAGQGDHVVWVDPGGTAQHDSTTAITLDKSATALFGSGAGMAKISSTSAVAISITAEACLVADLEAATTSSGSDAISIGGGAVGSTLSNVLVSASVDDGLVLLADHCLITNCKFTGCAGEGAQIQGQYTRIFDCIFFSNTSDGARTVSAQDENWFRGCMFTNNGEYGLADFADVTVVQDCVFHNNTDGAVSNGGTNIGIFGGMRSSDGYAIATLNEPVMKKIF